MTRPKHQLTGARGCKCCCPGGGACVCNPDVKHHLHICQHEECYCHTEARYIEAKHQARAAPAQPQPAPMAEAQG